MQVNSLTDVFWLAGSMFRPSLYDDRRAGFQPDDARRPRARGEQAGAMFAESCFNLFHQAHLLRGGLFLQRREGAGD